MLMMIALVIRQIVILVIVHIIFRNAVILRFFFAIRFSECIFRVVWRPLWASRSIRRRFGSGGGVVFQESGVRLSVVKNDQSEESGRGRERCEKICLVSLNPVVHGDI
jgi:hypothetical protein